MKNKALFLDRDGVINEDVAYPHKPEQIVFNPGIFDLCLHAAQQGYCIVVITNQAGVAKGYFTEKEVIDLHKWMKDRFLEHGVSIAGFYYCPYHKNGTVEKYRLDSDCRKPKPGLFLKAAQDLDIDLGQSLMVGDKASDRIELEQLKCITIKSKYLPEGYDVESLNDVERFL
jgi:D-glycero-D-manno-heptose 1,7-bisphosphate phosphatase